MNWLKELLEKAAISDGKLDVDSLMKEVNIEFPKHAVPKDTYNTLAETKKQLDADIEARDTQLEELKKASGTSEELQAEIQKLQDENKEAKEQYEADLKDLTMNSAIKLALNGQVHDEDLVAGLFDKEKLVIGDDGKVVGLDDQLKSLQEEKAFLFKSDDEGSPDDKPGFKVGGDGKGTPPSDKPLSLGAAIAQRINK